MALDVVHSEMYISGHNRNSVDIFPLDADGDQAPSRSIAGSNTGLSRILGLAVDPVNEEIIATNPDNSGSSIRVFSREADGDVAPIRVIEGANTGLDLPVGVFVDLLHDEIYVTDPITDSVSVFPRTADGDVSPTRSISGPTTGLVANQWVFVSQRHDELYVSDRDSSIKVFSRTANGDAAPIRTIAGASTMMVNPQSILLTRNDELILAEESHMVLVFPRLADGDVAPTRYIAGGTTGLAWPFGLASTRAAEGSVGFAGPLDFFADGFESGDTSAWSSAVE